MIHSKRKRYSSGREKDQTVVKKTPAKEKSFGDTFKEARKSHGGGGGTFTWKGKKYTTDTKEDVEKRKKKKKKNVVQKIKEKEQGE